MKLQALRGFGDKKTQQIRLADFINRVDALDISWQDAISEALKSLKKENITCFYQSESEREKRWGEIDLIFDKA